MKKYTLRELAALTDSQLIGHPAHEITGVATLEAASAEQAAFIDNPRYEKQLIESKAGVVFIQPILSPLPGKNYLLSPHPTLAFQKVLELFLFPSPSGFVGIHETAVIHPSVLLEEGVSIGPHAVIDRGVKIGARTSIGAGSFVGAESTIGSECVFYPHATVRERCLIGNRVIIQSGAVIGSCGFGYFTTPQGEHLPLQQLGQVILEDDVEIGANTTIDRARFETTKIGRGTKIDNLVQIAHQVHLGKNNLIVSQVGIAGSTETGNNVVMGGQVGVAGHITITDGVILAARAAVSKSLLQSGAYSGAPATPIKEFNHQFVQIRSVGKWIERFKELEKKIRKFEELVHSHLNNP
ncbi:MAG: UDP-3-O-(3-hydroxymyristoyl)glucosamine N-acyltransferase [Chlamydiia bacterium]|nr:UDP-3-O-(3-hydroxymyristoyl)glucosamine N-acyltransferase [Chlamydiia bacterium]